MKAISSVCINASTAKVWELLSDIEKVSIWAEPVLEAKCTSPSNVGVGAERVCKLKGNMQVKETWVGWNEGKSFTYVAEGIPFTKSAKNTWSIEDENGITLLTSVAEIEFKKGILGYLMAAVMKLAMKRQAPQALATFKYWVENGTPYTGKPSALKLGPTRC